MARFGRRSGQQPLITNRRLFSRPDVNVTATDVHGVGSVDNATVAITKRAAAGAPAPSCTVTGATVATTKRVAAGAGAGTGTAYGATIVAIPDIVHGNAVCATATVTVTSAVGKAFFFVECATLTGQAFRVKKEVGYGQAHAVVDDVHSNWPTIRERVSGTQSSDSTSHAVAVSGLTQVGDLLLCVVSTTGAPTCTDGSGLWTKMGQRSNGSAVTGAVFWKKAAGGDALTITTTAPVKSTHICYTIKDGDVPVGVSMDGSSINADPPRLAV